MYKFGINKKFMEKRKYDNVHFKMKVLDLVRPMRKTARFVIRSKLAIFYSYNICKWTYASNLHVCVV